MPKSSRGGKSGTSGFVPPFIAQTQQAQPQSPQPPQPTQPLQNISTTYDAFLKMTDDQKADVIMQAEKTPVPVFLANNSLQRVLYGLKLNDKPELVDDSVLDKMPGQDIFRNVNEAADGTNRIKFSADEIAAQVIRGSVTRVSDTGGSAHGRGIYFADSYQRSAVYGDYRGNIKRTAVIRAKLNSNARTISEGAAVIGARSEIRSGSKLGAALSKISSTDQSSIWALAKGYNVIVANNGYHVVLNRTALTASKTIKAQGTKW